MGAVSEGIGLAIIGTWQILWAILKIVANILITTWAVTQYTTFHGIYWYAACLLLFCVIQKIIFIGNEKAYEKYNKLLANYNEKYKDDIDVE